MADEDLDLDVKGGSKLNTILLIVVIVLLLVAIGVGAMFFLGGDDKPAGEAVQSAEPQPQPKEAHYLQFEHFVHTFPPTEPVRHLQIQFQLMSRDAAALNKVEALKPVIKSEVTILLSDFNAAQLRTVEGKNQLAEAIKAKVHELIGTEAKDAEGKDPEKKDASASGPIEQVYFTMFILQ